VVPLPSDCEADALLKAHLELAEGSGASDEPRFAGVLLRTHDRPVGYLHLARRVEQPAFDVGERRLLGIFAGQVAASLDNARLYQALKDQNRQTIEALAEAIEARDAHTYGHSRQVTRYAVRLAQELGLSAEQIELIDYAGLLHDVGKIGIRDYIGHSRQVTRYAVRLAQELGLSAEQIELIDYAGLLHDVGKIGIRDYILLKPDKLDDDEFEVMKGHPRIGVKIIERVWGLRPTLPIIEAHHERYDGKGYPHGLKGEAIPLEARILAIADAFEAMTADRAYRPAMPIEQALEILLRGRGHAWESTLVDLFVALLRREGAALLIADRTPQHTVPLLRPREVAVAVGDGRD